MIAQTRNNIQHRKNDLFCSAWWLVISIIVIIPSSLRFHQFNYVTSLPRKMCRLNNNTPVYHEYITGSSLEFTNISVTDLYNRDIVISGNSTLIYPSTYYFSIGYGMNNAESVVKSVLATKIFSCYYIEQKNIVLYNTPWTGIWLFIFILGFISCICAFIACICSANSLRNLYKILEPKKHIRTEHSME